MVALPSTVFAMKYFALGVLESVGSHDTSTQETVDKRRYDT